MDGIPSDDETTTSGVETGKAIELLPSIPAVHAPSIDKQAAPPAPATSSGMSTVAALCFTTFVLFVGLGVGLIVGKSVWGCSAVEAAVTSNESPTPQPTGLACADDDAKFSYSLSETFFVANFSTWQEDDECLVPYIDPYMSFLLAELRFDAIVAT